MTPILAAFFIYFFAQSEWQFHSSTWFSFCFSHHRHFRSRRIWPSALRLFRCRCGSRDVELSSFQDGDYNLTHMHKFCQKWATACRRNCVNKRAFQGTEAKRDLRFHILEKLERQRSRDRYFKASYYLTAGVGVCFHCWNGGQEILIFSLNGV